MRDRLIALIKEAERAFPKDKPILDIEEFVADHLLANGVIVPFAECGADIYGAFEWCPDEVCEGTLISYSIQRDGTWFYCHYSNGLNMWHKIEDFGKTVFLTKEESEEALKGGGYNGIY